MNLLTIFYKTIMNKSLKKSNIPPFNSSIGVGYNDIVCANCLTHERHFKGGHSWSPDLCPCGCQDTIPWYKLTECQKLEAIRKYNQNEKQ